MIYVIIWLWAAVVVADTVTTLVGVGQGRVEGNRFMRATMRLGGPELFIVVMSALGTLFAWCVLELYQVVPWAGGALGGFAIGYRGAVVVRNIGLIVGVGRKD